ncbi:AmmeMemoRadiSam system radical SAM enzyme [Selenomonas sp. TAMA-11512]|uniref:AmmeMemoRadiSam system radical SAM enzyme n=1 Tax=Selenomonas sp. TAMA-11512 TaxID=3095337 RepID=UPI00308B754A|nr:AmmeMemoRadiSam system radical SAM enzyme [Selenomonas sp. TAMA-11512]
MADAYDRGHTRETALPAQADADERVTCTLCPHACRLRAGETGFCRARENVGGVIRAKNYGRLTALALDPIEKKPLYHFHPGSFILSVGSFGCNLACPFCQNAAIAMADDSIETEDVSPERLAALAADLRRRAPGNLGVAFTYNEPLVGFEYILDTAPLLHAAGMRVVLVTNGMISDEPLARLLPHVDAMNIDLKGWREEHYRRLGGNLETVKATIARAAEMCHVEVTTLIVPGMNDGTEDMDEEARWLASLSPDLPLHISRYFPRHRLSTPPTPIETVDRLTAIAARHLHHVHRGNC